MLPETEFRRPQLSDKELITSYFRRFPSRNCDRTFANIYLWAKFYHVEFAEIDNVLLFKDSQRPHTYAYPVGAKEDVKKLLEALIDDCHRAEGKFFLYGVSPPFFEQLEEWFPGELTIAYNPDLSDYVYEREKLATLSGKKLHGKRNHINKFMATYPDFQYEPINERNIEECFQMAIQWRTENVIGEEDGEKVTEMSVTLNSLRLFKELGLVGGILRVDGEIVAITMGEPVNEDTFVVHVEKALPEFPGAYPMINQQFVQHSLENYTYVNREEDLGVEGLRKAKQSYRPAFMIEKGLVRFKKKEEGEER